MKTKGFRNINYVGLVVIILAFLFIYFSYFFIYIPKKEAHLQQKGFRILKEYGSNMIDKRQYFENHFKNYGIFYSIKFLTDSNEIIKADTALIDKIYRKESPEIDKVISQLFQFVITKHIKTEALDFVKGKGQEMLLSFNSTNNDLTLVKKYYRKKDKQNIENDQFEDFSYQVPISSFMENLKFDELFENIFFFDSSDILYSTENGNLDDITNPAALCDSTKNSQGGIYKKLNIRGEKKHVVVIPIAFAGKQFYLAGLISDSDYISKTRTINKQLLFFIAGILLLISAGMPILKIILIDSKERLKASDVTNSSVSLIFGISLFILIVFAFIKKQAVDRVTHEKRIEKISDKLYSNVLNDIDSLKVLGSGIANKSTLQYASLQKEVVNKFNSVNRFYQDSNLCGPFSLNEIILMNKNGIFSKGYTRTPFSDIVNVDLSERQYFRNIKDIEKSWPTSDSLNLNIYIESIKSLNTGAVETAISFFTQNFDSLIVLAITSKIPSLYQQVLPKDIEFVIINKNGRVLYHSIEEKNLHENFVLECESDIQLVNAVNSGNTGIFQIRYNEKTWLARIQPFKNAPLFHITLLDLNQADNINARIFLFTFYFLIATLIFIVAGLLILHWITFSQVHTRKNNWFLSWLVFDPAKSKLYNILSIILLSIIAVQLIGLFIKVSPVTILLYQFILIVYSLFATMAFLNRSEFKTNKAFRDEFLLESNILLATVLLMLFFILKFEITASFLFQLVFLVVLTIFIFSFLKKYKPPKVNYKFSHRQNEIKLKRHYLIFLFLWLLCISAIPVTVYYFSVKKQEEERWNKEQLYKVAEDNIELQTVYGNPEKEWFKRIQGNGIDNLNVKYLPFVDNLKKLNDGDVVGTAYPYKIYSSLPDPVSGWYNQPKLQATDKYINSVFYNDTLIYRTGLKEGSILVNYSDRNRLFPILNYMILVSVVIIFIGLCAWFLIKYMASVLLNLNMERPAIPEVSWRESFNDSNARKILLKSFDGKCFLEKSGEIVKSKESVFNEIAHINALELVKDDFKVDSLPSDKSKIIWISGLNQVIYDFDKHENFLTLLSKLNQISLCRIIIELPFDPDLINEYYDDYTASAQLKPEQLTQVFVLRKKWMNLFNNYISFNGFLNQNIEDGSGALTPEDKYKPECIESETETRLLQIWNNLTSLEKIVLFDLADDGLMNRKNKEIIQKLINKRIILPNPAPSFFSNEFREFVMKNIKSEEVKSIEEKLGLKGNWHNAKYLILFILVPLAAFIVISQGISIEKVFGIFAGGLAIITGILRLLDSSSFK